MDSAKEDNIFPIFFYIFFGNKFMRDRGEGTLIKRLLPTSSLNRALNYVINALDVFTSRCWGILTSLPFKKRDVRGWMNKV